ncbi:hypothetical protein BH09SUM1_BH09SUM1_22740 [soil metagenome]
MRKIFLCLALLAGVVAAAAGCGNKNRVPRYNVEKPLEITPFKRQTKHDNVDYLYQWKAKAYSPVSSPIRKRLSESEQDVLARHGQPDWVRKRFQSLADEQVDEWAWWDRSVICQFVQGELVYEGELTDMDRTRIRYGYPRRAWSETYEAGVQRDIWDYQGMVFDNDGQILTFSNEKLVTQQRY